MARLKSGFSGERRTAFCGFQVTPTERAELEGRAAAAGLCLSDYLRRASLGAAAVDAKAIARRDPQKLALVNELSRLGNNLNQLAHRTNATGQVRIEEAALALLDEIKAVLRGVL